MEKHILAKPIVYEGETYKEINFDFDNLKRKDLDKAEKITRTKHGKTLITVVELNKTYQMYLAAMAADVPAGVLSEEYLGAKDYTQIALMVQDFLLGGESDTAEAEAMEQLEEYLRGSGRMKNIREKKANAPTNLPEQKKLDDIIMALASGKISDVEALENMPLHRLSRHIENYAQYVERRNKAIEESSKRRR